MPVETEFYVSRNRVHMPVDIIDKNKCYKTKPVSVEEFFNSKYHIGEVNIWDSPKRDLIQLLDPNTPYNRGLFIQPPGSGKSYKGALFLLYCLYRLGNLKDPLKFYGMDATSSVGVMNMSISGRTAQGTIWSSLRNMLMGSPWFKKYCKLDEKIESQIRLPKPLVALSGNSSEAFPAGWNIFGAVVDEITMFLSKSHRGAYQDQAQNIFEVLEERTESRFLNEGYVLAMGASSYLNDFVEEMINRTKEESGENILLIRNPLWHAQPQERFCGDYLEFDTVKQKILPGGPYKGLFSEENREEILRQIEMGLTSADTDMRDEPGVADKQTRGPKKKSRRKLLHLAAV